MTIVTYNVTSIYIHSDNKRNIWWEHTTKHWSERRHNCCTTMKQAFPSFKKFRQLKLLTTLFWCALFYLTYLLVVDFRQKYLCKENVNFTFHFIASIYMLYILMSLNMTFVLVQWPPKSQDVPSKSVLWIQFVHGLRLWLESYCYLSKVGKALASTNLLSSHSQRPLHPAGFSFSCSFSLWETHLYHFSILGVTLPLATCLLPITFASSQTLYPLRALDISVTILLPLLSLWHMSLWNMQILFYFGWDDLWMNSNLKRIKYTPNIPHAIK